MTATLAHLQMLHGTRHSAVQ